MDPKNSGSFLYSPADKVNKSSQAYQLFS